MLENIINKSSSSNTNDFPDDKTLDHAVLKTVLYALTDIKTGKSKFSKNPCQYINLWENYLNPANKLLEKPEDISGDVYGRIKEDTASGLEYHRQISDRFKRMSIFFGIASAAFYLMDDVPLTLISAGILVGYSGLYAVTRNAINKLTKFQKIGKDRLIPAIKRMEDTVREQLNQYRQYEANNL